MIAMWWPSCLFGILLRGFYSDLVGLKPSNYLGYCLIGMLATGVGFVYLQTLVSYLQSVFGTLFFVPKMCIPGYHKFLVPLSQVPKEKHDEECIICYYPLKSLPNLDGEIEPVQNAHPSSIGSGKNEEDKEGQPKEIAEPILKKSKKVMVTQCKHYFHVYCLNKWLEKKTECPICRAKVKYYG